MLVLSRKKNESIVINSDIVITVVEIRGDKVRLGIVAPKDVPVHREEVYEAIHGSTPAKPAEPAGRVMPRTVAIVGASADRRKFGNKSIRAHAAAGWQVFPVHPTETSIEGLTAFRTIADIPLEELDRISVYLAPAVALKVMESFGVKPVGEVWLNPGADDDTVVEKAKWLGLNVVKACSIVDVGHSPSQFADA